MQDIADAIGKERVTRVIDRFYDRIQEHARLKIPFAVVRDWVHHKEILTHFWWVTLGGERYLDYSYTVANKHQESGFTPALLGDWLPLFHEIVREEVPEKTLADGWLERADRIGQSLTYLHEVTQRNHAVNPTLFKPA
jgi:hemoglobin